MTVEAVQHPYAMLFGVSGRVDGENAGELQQVLLAGLTPEVRYLVLDLAELAYISSMGLSTILTVAKRLDAQSGTLMVSGLNAKLRQTFQFSGFDTLFPVHLTVAEALADCERRATAG